MEESGASIKPQSKYLAWPLAMFSDRLAVQVAAACIFVSEENKKEAIKYYKVDPQKCFVVESGVNSSLFKPVGDEEKEKTRKDLGLDMLDKVVLNYGAVVERKNVHLLVDALPYLPALYKLILAGDGDPAYIETINEMIKKKNLADRVLRVGYIPYPQVPVAIQASDVFVLPSSWEGLPKVVIESLACGVPCLVSGFKLSEDVKGVYYLDDLDPKYIAKRIVEIVENIREVDVNKMVSLYSWDQKVLQIEQIYEFAKKNYL